MKEQRGCQFVMPANSIRVVSFSGIDGAGKSTQIEALRAHLRESGFRSTLYTFWDNVVVFPGLREHMSFKAFRGDKGVGSPDKPISRRDKNVTSWYITAARLFLYLLDAYSLRVAVAGSSFAGADFVIFDRYIYDELANLPLGRPPVRLYVTMLLRLIPKPDVAYIVDADPEAAHLRKPEYPLEFVRTNRDAYITLSRLVRNLTVLEPLSVEETTTKIKESISKKYPPTHVATVDFPLACAAGPSQAKTPNA
jgi:thymidylate kinase